MTKFAPLDLNCPKPHKTEETIVLQENLKALQPKRGFKIQITNGENIVSAQRRIGATVYTMAKKLGVKFTIRVLDDNTLGVWRIK